jgi:wyosine [tRNA(Phe)-imidazoG37] synthetase (radical SAM superfamily)
MIQQARGKRLESAEIGRRRVYGPVPSRRLGMSLGVDIVPFKVCPYDCIYCQLGPTRLVSTRRETFFPVHALVEQVKHAVDRGPRPDVITLAGSGEPTLYKPLGRLIRALKAITDIPVVLLTNGALFADPEIRREAALADRVLPSLDAGDEGLFRIMNRPRESITLERVVRGLETFRDEYAGPIWLEVMVVAGLSDGEPQARLLAEQARRIRPDRIHLNTPVRPSLLGPSAIVPQDRLQAICSLFTPAAEVIADFKPAREERGDRIGAIEGRLFELLARRPCTVEDAAAGLAAAPNEVVKALSALESSGRIESTIHDLHRFYSAKGNKKTK